MGVMLFGCANTSSIYNIRLLRFGRGDSFLFNEHIIRNHFEQMCSSYDATYTYTKAQLVEKQIIIRGMEVNPHKIVRVH